MTFCQLMEFVALFERDVAHNFDGSVCIPHFCYGNKETKKMRLKMTMVASSKDHKHRLLDSYSI